MKKCPCDIPPSDCPLYLIVSNHLEHVNNKLRWSLGLNAAIFAAVIAKFIMG